MLHSLVMSDGKGRKSAADWAGLANLFVVYIVWGSTYLAIRIAVREGSGFPPFAMGASRIVLAGVILLLWAKFTRRRLRLSRNELSVLVASGELLWAGGNGLLIWAEQRIHSAYAALLIGSTPIWGASIEAVIDRRAPSALLISSLVTAFLGIGLLSFPILSAGATADLLGVLALLCAAFCWASGSILQNRRKVETGARVSSGYQQLFGGLSLAVLMLISGEPTPHPTAHAWWAWGYLVVFGSLLAFTSFIHAIHSLLAGLVFTYAYVNPVIAVFLGWLVLDEPVTAWTIGGAALVLMGVAGVFRDRMRHGARVGKVESRVEPV